jgi:hypothetical protein
MVEFDMFSEPPVAAEDRIQIEGKVSLKLVLERSNFIKTRRRRRRYRPARSKLTFRQRGFACALCLA